MATTTAPPQGIESEKNPTVYVRNLEERIKPDQLKEALSEVFSEYGNIIDLIAKRNLKAKGQAFVVFDDADAAERAIDEIQGFELFDKPMVLDYARTRSDATVKRVGSGDEFETHKRRRLAEKERKQAQKALESQQSAAHRPENAASAANPTTRPTKARGGLKSTNTAGAGAVIPDEYLPPNKILFIRDLPEDYDIEALTTIFSRFEGFREIRTVPGRKGIAFVEYENETGAISAKERTAGMVLGDAGKGIRVTFQRQ